MDTIADTFYHFFRQLTPPIAGLRITVSVSGGVDSVSLLHVASRFTKSLGYSLNAVHFHHGLRKESSEEEASVLSFCESLSIPCQVRRFSADDWEMAPGTGMEEKARELRNQAYQSLLRSDWTDWILLGHTRDDWEETVLFHWIRGCSPSHLAEALKSQDPARKILRPFLTLSKSSLIDYAQKHQLPVHEDISNFDTTYSRNKIRQRILPLIHEINPNFGQALLHFTSVLKAEEDVLEALTQEALQHVAQTMEAECCTWDKALWQSQSPAIQLRLLRKLREHLVGNQRDFYYSQLISIQMGIMTNMWFHYEDKKICIDCTEKCIIARRQAINEQ